MITNIPAALVETVENGQVVTLHAAGVGKIDRQSPIMNTKATQINFNPTWTVPASIVKKDLIPKMQKDPNYLTDNKIRIFTGRLRVSPRPVNWFSDEGTRYTYRQDSGADFNSMGIVRINIPNPYGVFMHDTNTKGVFGDDFRFISSGCVRVQNVREYITWLLKDTPGWGRQQVEEAIESGKRIDANIAQPVAGLLDLHHRLGDPGRPRPVPRRHLQPRRLRQRGPGGEPGPDRAGRGDVPAELRPPPLPR